MATRFVDVDEARVYSGISSTLISDADMTEIIQDIEYQVEKYLNCDLAPTIEIESQDGNSKTVMFTNRAPLLSLRALTVNDTEITLSTTDFDKSGRIRLLTGANSGTFTNLKNKVYIKYVHGRVQWDKTTATETTADSAAGTTVALSVTSESGFATGDWVEISSFDGNKEVAHVTATGTGSITVDQLVLTHDSGATVRKLVINSTILRLIKTWIAISATVRAVGQSFDEITGYTMGEFQVQKGEPFTQFREAIIRFEAQAKDLMKTLRPTPGVIM